MSALVCTSCNEVFEAAAPDYKCKNCGGIGTLEYKVNYESLGKITFSGDFNFWRYRNLLPKIRNYVSLHEGGTPLYRAERLARHLKLSQLYLKDETRNPTNSFRDRAAALMVSNMLDLGYTAAVCASNGNMGAALAAYCAKYELACHIIIPRHIDVGKLAQMIIYDAVIEEYGETVDDSIKRAISISEETGWYQATSAINPLTIEAQKTIAFEIAEQIGVPDVIIVPMGSGGTIYSIWKGFRELVELGIIKGIPRLIGVQSSGCSPIVDAYLGKRERAIEKPVSRATSILMIDPLRGNLALKAIKESGGLAIAVSDHEILEAEQEIARMEGLFAEPASSGTIAALKRLINDSIISDESVVCLITGSGLKATDVLQAISRRRRMILVETDLSTKEKILRIIAGRETYGYEIWKMLGKNMTKAAVYQHLNELRIKGLISVQMKNGRKYFSITQKGRKVLEAIEEVKILMS